MKLNTIWTRWMLTKQAKWNQEGENKVQIKMVNIMKQSSLKAFNGFEDWHYEHFMSNFTSWTNGIFIHTIKSTPWLPSGIKSKFPAVKLGIRKGNEDFVYVWEKEPRTHWNQNWQKQWEWRVKTGRENVEPFLFVNIFKALNCEYLTDINFSF